MAGRFASATIPQNKEDDMIEQTIAELIAERDEMKRRWDDSPNIQRIQSETLERMIAAIDAEQNWRKRDERTSENERE